MQLWLYWNLKVFFLEYFETITLKIYVILLLDKMYNYPSNWVTQICNPNVMKSNPEVEGF